MMMNISKLLQQLHQLGVVAVFYLSDWKNFKLFVIYPQAQYLSKFQRKMEIDKMR